MPIVPTRPGTLVLMKGVRRTAPHDFLPLNVAVLKPKTLVNSWLLIAQSLGSACQFINSVEYSLQSTTNIHPRYLYLLSTYLLVGKCMHHTKYLGTLRSPE